jgi:hypothetical protein
MTRAPRQLLLTGWVEHSRPSGCPEITWGRTFQKCKGLPVKFKEWCSVAEDIGMEIADVLETYASFRELILQGS